MEYDEAVEVVTARGARFETATGMVKNVQQAWFINVPRSLRELFCGLRRRGGSTFLVYEDERWTFDRVCDEIAAVGSMLVQRFGVEPGDRVAIAMRNYPEWVVAFGAAVSIGAIAVPLNALGSAGELSFGLSDSGAKVVFADHERIERMRPWTLPTIGVRCSIDGIHRWPSVGASLPEVEVASEQDATILYTAGTTGAPKGAVSTHGAILQSLAGFRCRGEVQRLVEHGPRDAASDRPPVFILTVPLFHVTGLVAVLLSCVGNGLKLVMMHRWEPERALQLIERESVTNIRRGANPILGSAPPSAVRSLRHLVFAECGSWWRAGAARARSRGVRKVSARTSGARIWHDGDECVRAQNAGTEYESNPTSSGRGTPILQIAIRDDEGRDVEVGKSGEIWFKGPHLIRGYWNRLEETAATITEGWLRTGDLGRVDERGLVYVEDRLKDVILRGGENIYCGEIEATISRSHLLRRQRCSVSRTNASARSWLRPSWSKGVE